MQSERQWGTHIPGQALDETPASSPDVPVSSSTGARSPSQSRNLGRMTVTVDDEQLIEQIAHDDEEAFEQLFHRYYESVCRFVTQFVRSPDIAKELTQDIFFRIWDNRAVLQITGSVRAYLYGAARNHALNFLKRERVRSNFFLSATAEHRSPAVGRGFTTPDESLFYAELTRAFEAALQRLPERQRTLLELRWRHHLTHAEIADAIGISIKGVETQIGRAIKTLRARLAKFR